MLVSSWIQVTFAFRYDFVTIKLVSKGFGSIEFPFIFEFVGDSGDTKPIHCLTCGK